MSNKGTSSVRHLARAGWWHTSFIPPPFIGMGWKPFILVIQKSWEKNSYIMRTPSRLIPPFLHTHGWQKREERKDVFENEDKRVSVSLTHLPKGVISVHNSILLLILQRSPPLTLLLYSQSFSSSASLAALWKNGSLHGDKVPAFTENKDAFAGPEWMPFKSVRFR